MPVTSAAFSPDGKLLATVCGLGLHLTEIEEPPPGYFRLVLWDVPTWEVKASVSGDTGQLLSVAFSPDGKLLATGDCGDVFCSDGPGAVRLWQVQAILKGGKQPVYPAAGRP